MTNRIQQARLVTTQSALVVDQGVTELALFDSNGQPVNLGSATPSAKGLVKRTPAITDVTVPNASDAATAITLANANKAKLNELIAALRTAGVITA